MSAAATRSQWSVVRTCLLPQIVFQRSGYHVESVDGVDQADCWFVEIEWLSLTLHIAGGKFRPGGAA